MSSRAEWVELVDGPMAGRKVDMWIGTRGLIPEVQYCTLPGCIAMHPITHEYTAAGRWIRSYSYLGIERESNGT